MAGILEEIAANVKDYGDFHSKIVISTTQSIRSSRGKSLGYLLQKMKESDVQVRTIVSILSEYADTRSPIHKLSWNPPGLNLYEDGGSFIDRIAEYIEKMRLRININEFIGDVEPKMEVKRGDIIENVKVSRKMISVDTRAEQFETIEDYFLTEVFDGVTANAFYTLFQTDLNKISKEGTMKEKRKIRPILDKVLTYIRGMTFTEWEEIQPVTQIRANSTFDARLCVLIDNKQKDFEKAKRRESNDHDEKLKREDERIIRQYNDEKRRKREEQMFEQRCDKCLRDKLFCTVCRVGYERGGIVGKNEDDNLSDITMNTRKAGSDHNTMDDVEQELQDQSGHTFEQDDRQNYDNGGMYQEVDIDMDNDRSDEVEKYMDEQLKHLSQQTQADFEQAGLGIENVRIEENPFESKIDTHVYTKDWDAELIDIELVHNIDAASVGSIF